MHESARRGAPAHRLVIGRRDAIRALAGEAIPPLTELLKDPEVRVRVSAVMALGQIGPEAKTAVSALTELLKDPVAFLACRPLGP